MKKIKECYFSSFREFTSPRGLTLCGLMCALAVVLNLTARIDIGEYVRISFSELANRVVEFLLGPFVGAVFGGVTDIVNFIVKPTGTFFPGFTFDKMIEGLIFGAILYKKPLKPSRVFTAQLLVKAIVNCGLNTLWLRVLYGQAVSAILPVRLFKNAVMLPIDTAITFALLCAASRILQRLHLIPAVSE